MRIVCIFVPPYTARYFSIFADLRYVSSSPSRPTADEAPKVGMMETTLRKRVFRVRLRRLFRPPPATATATPRARRACVRIRNASFTVSLVAEDDTDALLACRVCVRERCVRRVRACACFPIVSVSDGQSHRTV